MDVKTYQDYEFRFVRLEDGKNTGWWLEIRDQMDLNHYRTTFMRDQFAKAAVNILEGKEYNAPFTIGHGPFVKQSALSEYARLHAANMRNLPPQAVRTPEIMDRLGFIYNQKITEFQRLLHENRTFYVNRSGGYFVPDANTIDKIIEIVMSGEFPERTVTS